MRRIVATLVLALLWCGAAQAQGTNDSFFTFVWENDKFSGTDRNYTNGVRLSFTKKARDDGLAGSIAGLFLYATSGNPRVLFQGTAIGHSIFTPEDTAATVPLPDQHPYAGWLYGEYSVIAANLCTSGQSGCRRGAESLALQVGIVGPSAQGEFVQNNFHRLIGVDPANGWANQLHDEVGVNVLYDYRFQAWTSAGPGPADTHQLVFDVVPSYGFVAGNVLTQASAGLTLRLGQNFDKMDLPARVRPSTPGAGLFSGPDCHRNASLFDCLGWYVFASVEGRAVARDIFLDGNTFRDSLHVNRHPFIADFQLGLVARLHDVEIAYTYVTRTEEFETQSSEQQFGSFSITYRY